jgi:hypothetical protein
MPIESGMTPAVGAHVVLVDAAHYDELKRGGLMMENMSEKERFDLIEVGSVEDLGTIVVTQAQIDQNRQVLDWPEAPFPVLHSPKPDATKALFPPRVNARSIRQFFNPPIAGKTVRLSMRIVDKYFRKDAPYVVEETTATDEDARILEIMTVHQLLRTRKVGEKWA